MNWRPQKIHLALTMVISFSQMGSDAGKDVISCPGMHAERVEMETQLWLSLTFQLQDAPRTDTES